MRWYQTALIVSTGLLIMALTLPLMRRRVPPNGMYGVRFPSTLADERVWYEVNARSGRDLLILGAVMVVLALAAHGLGWSAARQALVVGAVLGCGALLAAVRAFRHARRLQRAQ